MLFRRKRGRRRAARTPVRHRLTMSRTRRRALSLVGADQPSAVPRSWSSRR